MSSIYVSSTIQYAYSSSGPWYNSTSASNWGYGTSVSVIAYGVVQCGLYYRVAGAHYWPGGSLNTFGYPSYMYC